MARRRRCLGQTPARRFLGRASAAGGGLAFFTHGQSGRSDRAASTSNQEVCIANNEPRVNEQIRFSPVRLIDDKGEQVGVVPIEEAQATARERGLDLVEVAPTARPPVCRIMDYGRYKYEQAKADREARRKQHVTQMKEIKMRPNIEEHDFEFKTRHIKRFLEERNKVKVTIMFRGREMAHTENGREVLDDVIEEIGDLAVVEQAARLEGRNMFLILAPNMKANVKK
ncbi:MAG TPA: translation initiation factor IF-3 [Gemmatimonadota bacterium]|nr:translation initiation factor IF-3 [Gemmatimonadota bacterium]